MAITVNRRLYEGMFLVDSTQAADWDATTAVIDGILKKANAEIVSMRKWDDRRLAYEVDGKSRGTYILCYFRADGEKIQDIEKSVQLSEQIMRVLILSAEQMTAEDMEKDTPAARARKEAAAAEEARAARVAAAAAKAASIDIEAEAKQKGPELEAAEVGTTEAPRAPGGEAEAPHADGGVKEADESAPQAPGEAEEVEKPRQSDAGNIDPGDAESDKREA